MQSWATTVQRQDPNFAYYRGILQMADPGLHEKIVSLVDKYVPRQSRILDVAAGRGALSKQLLDRGYRVQASELDVTQFEAVGIECHQVNLNNEVQSIAGERGFSCALAVEVIEHLQNPWLLVANCCRLVAPGGIIVITTPNIVSALSRLTFLQTGEFYFFREMQSSGHINPLTPKELETIFSGLGLRVLERTTSGRNGWVSLRGTARQILGGVLAQLLRPFLRNQVEGRVLVYVLQRPA
jgi:2-polyprenyl-3-methyl-5-hydroxy-6-metoxy-1,4-benzoquinol methylase